MSPEFVLWIATACYGVHILEQYELNWRDWAGTVLRLPVERGSFCVVTSSGAVSVGRQSISPAFARFGPLTSCIIFLYGYNRVSGRDGRLRVG